MLRRNRIIPFLIIYLFALQSFGEIVWLDKDYDFGLMKEEAGKKTGFSRFVNSGSEPISITGMRPSCGCTSADYPHDPIAPGDTATVYFTYDPKGRPGRFQKSVRMYIGTSETYIIRIKGNVLGTPESLSIQYPVETGSLRLSTPLIAAGEIPFGSTRYFFLNGYNQSSDSISPKLISTNPSLSISASADKLGPGDIVTYCLYFNSRQIDKPGFVNIPVKIFPAEENPEIFTTVGFTVEVTPPKQDPKLLSK